MPQTRQAILNAAAELFARSGYHGAQTRAIAKRARVNEGSIYRIFKTKRRLYREVLEWRLRQAAMHSLSAIDGSPDELIHRLIEAGHKDPVAVRLLYYGALDGMPEFKKVMCEVTREYFERLTAHIEQQKAAGGVRPEVPALPAAVALTSFGVYHHLLFELLDGGAAVGDHPEAEFRSFYSRLWACGVCPSVP